jgi:quercetin dioxygenase-like cupin family protein
MGSIHRRRADGSWEGVAPAVYGEQAVAGVEKHDLIGPADGAGSYRVRYFHVPAGARTALERHPHDHGDDVHELGPGDVVYVEGDELHCFEAVGDTPLGFICVAPPAGSK